MRFQISFCVVLSVLCAQSLANDYTRVMNRFLEAVPIHPQIRTPDVWLPESNVKSKTTTDEPYSHSSFGAQADCNKKYTGLKYGDTGTISSPNYPRNYPARKSCEWYIEGPPGSRIQAVVLDMVTQPFRLIYNDYVLFARGGNFSYVDRLSGDMSSQMPMVITSHARGLGIRFRSNSLTNFRGFKLQYLVLPAESENSVHSFEKPVFDGVCGQSYADLPPKESANAPQGESVFESPNVDEGPNPFPIINGKPTKTFSAIYTVAGREVRKYAYPWMVALLIDGKHFCGGSLIDEQHVMTAAHCTYRAQEVTLMLGSYSIDATRSGEEDDRLVFNVNRRNIFQHTEYNPNTHAYDITIIRLPEKIEFNNRVRPVCLPNRRFISRFFYDDSALVSGWGQQDDTITRANPYLREAPVKVIPTDQCQVAFRGIINGNLICSSTTQYNSPCKGDAGSPLMVKQQSALGAYYMQIGIVSFGAATCENALPFGYTRVTAFLDFINQVTGKNL